MQSSAYGYSSNMAPGGGGQAAWPNVNASNTNTKKKDGINWRRIGMIVLGLAIIGLVVGLVVYFIRRGNSGDDSASGSSEAASEGASESASADGSESADGCQSASGGMSRGVRIFLYMLAACVGVGLLLGIVLTIYKRTRKGSNNNKDGDERSVDSSASSVVNSAANKLEHLGERAAQLGKDATQVGKDAAEQLSMRSTKPGSSSDGSSDDSYDADGSQSGQSDRSKPP